MDKKLIHQSVMPEEVIAGLAIKPNGVYVDATFGRGGHARMILAALGKAGRLLVMDKDPVAIKTAQQEMIFQDPRFDCVHAAFTELKNWVMEQQLLGKINGILFDLGVSSPQLDDPARGFSFMRDGPLDMRMDITHGLTAAQWLAKAEEKEIADVLWNYGEERFSRKIARAIVEVRKETPIETTKQFAELIAKASPMRDRFKHPATRSFQAIRIFINNELQALTEVLQQSLEVLAIGGRLVVISFHSLEDRIVKQFFRTQSQTAKLPRNLPILPMSEEIPRLRLIGKAIKPKAAEIAENSRARSAVLRIAEKLR